MPFDRYASEILFSILHSFILFLKISLDGDFESFLPPMEEFVNSTELEDLVSNKSFKYLLKLTYEYINDAYKKNDEIMEM